MALVIEVQKSEKRSVDKHSISDSKGEAQVSIHFHKNIAHNQVFMLCNWYSHLAFQQLGNLVQKPTEFTTLRFTT
jgi:hypothetical protein